MSITSKAKPAIAGLPSQRDHSDPQSEITPDSYAAIIDSAMRRLVQHVQEAVDDGTWAVAEAAQLHAWVRAELLPWAAELMRTADPTTRETLAPVFTQLAQLDAELLGTCGRPAAALAHKLQDSGTQLLRMLPGA